MRVLFLHPEDDPLDPRWASQRWDQVIDLGFSGRETYDRWASSFQCPVRALPSLDFSDLRRIRRTLLSGCGQLLDSHGLDWWELISIRFHEQLERIIAIEKAANFLSAGDQVFFSRECFQACAMGRLCRTQVHCFPIKRSGLQRFRRLASTPLKLGLSQSVQVLGDKYDAGYKLRRLMSSRARPGKKPVVLLPSAYVNASRMAVSYAESLPRRDFLVVATRRSGRSENLPPNVRAQHLASYAPGRSDQGELRNLCNLWRDLRSEIVRNANLSILGEIGTLDCVPRFLAEGLAIRNAWLRVFELERVISVLCTDDSNPYTHIPLLIARSRNVPTIACHHGALDGRHTIKHCRADVILAKGEMERDYLVRKCGLSEEQVEIGAPASPGVLQDAAARNSIVFFSEPYEISGSRCRELYREILPRLAKIAAGWDRKLVVKLHPQESRRGRESTVRSVLSPQEFACVRIEDGSLREELLQDTWFAVTVLSTTAVDCAIRGIPAFLCKWLDHSNYGYLDQFARFGAGEALDSVDELFEIPQRLEGRSRDSRKLWEPISRDRLDRLLTDSRLATLVAAV